MEQDFHKHCTLLYKAIHKHLLVCCNLTDRSNCPFPIFFINFTYLKENKNHLHFKNNMLHLSKPLIKGSPNNVDINLTYL